MSLRLETILDEDGQICSYTAVVAPEPASDAAILARLSIEKRLVEAAFPQLQDITAFITDAPDYPHYSGGWIGMKFFAGVGATRAESIESLRRKLNEHRDEIRKEADQLEGKSP